MLQLTYPKVAQPKLVPFGLETAIYIRYPRIPDGPANAGWVELWDGLKKISLSQKRVRISGKKSKGNYNTGENWTIHEKIEILLPAIKRVIWFRTHVWSSAFTKMEHIKVFMLIWFAFLLFTAYQSSQDIFCQSSRCRRILILIIIIMSCRQHGYPWSSLTTSPYRSSPLAGLGYITELLYVCSSWPSCFFSAICGGP